MAEPGFWNNQEKAQATLQEIKSLRGWVDPYDKLNGRVVSALELDEMLQEGSEPEMERELDNGSRPASRRSRRHSKLKSLLRGPDDFRDAQLEISAGAGGTEAQDWAQMLMRMYTRWAERKGFTVEILDLSEGEEAGIKGAVLEIKGQYAYGFLQARGRRASPRAHLAVRFAGAAAHELRVGVRVSRSSTTRSTSRSATRTSGWTCFARRAPAASTSTRPAPRCGSRTFRRAS